MRRSLNKSVRRRSKKNARTTRPYRKNTSSKRRRYRRRNTIHKKSINGSNGSKRSSKGRKRRSNRSNRSNRRKRTYKKRRIVGGAPHISDSGNSLLKFVEKHAEKIGMVLGQKIAGKELKELIPTLGSLPPDATTALKKLANKQETTTEEVTSVEAPTTVKGMVIKLFGGKGNKKTVVDDYHTAVDKFAEKLFVGVHVQEIKDLLNAYLRDTHLFKKEKDGGSVSGGFLAADAEGLNYDKLGKYSDARTVLLKHITDDTPIPHANLKKWADLRLLDGPNSPLKILNPRLESLVPVTKRKIEEYFGAQSAIGIEGEMLTVENMKESLKSFGAVAGTGIKIGKNDGQVRAEQILGSMFLKTTDDTQKLVETFVAVAKACGSEKAGMWLGAATDLDDIPLDVTTTSFSSENDVKRLFPKDGASGATFNGGIKPMLDELDKLEKKDYDNTTVVSAVVSAVSGLIDATSELKSSGSDRRTMFMIHMRGRIIRALTTENAGKKIIYQEFMKTIFDKGKHDDRMADADAILTEAEIERDKLATENDFGTKYDSLTSDQQILMRQMLTLFPRRRNSLDEKKIANIIKHFGDKKVTDLKKAELSPNVSEHGFDEIVDSLIASVLSKGTDEELNRCNSHDNFDS